MVNPRNLKGVKKMEDDILLYKRPPTLGEAVEWLEGHPEGVASHFACHYVDNYSEAVDILNKAKGL